jgi:tyrosinase
VADSIIENPTYMEHVRHFFDDEDLEHMFEEENLDLTTYPALKDAATDVDLHTRPPNAHMPPEPERKWSQERWQSFRNWMGHDFPLGAPQPQPVQTGSATRIRKDARDLSADEIETLRRAFRGIMDLPPDNEESYFFLAGQHWYPIPTECPHHEDRFFPWHRVFMRHFEDALRTIQGCAAVTLPYWDITAAPPAFLFTAPFDSYTLPRDAHRNPMNPSRDYPAGYSTRRNSAPEIMAGVSSYQIPQKIQIAVAEFQWQDFTHDIELGGHDNGHTVCGQSMVFKDVAAYDPLFWFFHSNWDRLWWEWQQIMQATTQWTFRSTITTGFTEFLTSPDHELKPFTEKAEEVINLSATGVGYARPSTAARDEPGAGPIESAVFGSVPASRKIRVRPGPLVSVRLKGINRLVIPGTFHAVLKANGEPLARQAFFQSTQPNACTACREKAIIDLDFRVEADAIIGRDLTADIELLTPDADRIGRRVPLRSCGDPTLNIRLLLQENP